MAVKDLYRYIVPDTSGIPLAPRIRSSGIINSRTIQKAYDTWQMQTRRFRHLYYAYVGMDRRVLVDVDESEDGLPDEVNTDRYGNKTINRVSSNFCNYIVTILEGYIAGNAPEYDFAENDVHAKEIVDLFKRQNKELVDADLIQDMSIYGRAFELIYRSDDDKSTPKSTVISPRDCFVAYSGDVEEDSVFGAVFYDTPAENGETDCRINIYTKTDVEEWHSYSIDDVHGWKLISKKPHGLGRVPLIEYRNNKVFMGDFESILALQKYYNRTMLNRVADVDAFAKSILLLVGSVMGQTPDEIKNSVKNLNEAGVLQMDNDGSSASYLERSLDETGVQILQDQIKSDIHKFSFVPDLSDEQFANNASGIAMAYKVFGTDQLIARKALNFQTGFMRRCKIYDYALNNPSLSPSYKPVTDLGAMRIVFKLNAPQDLSYMSSALSQLVQNGILSKDSARRSLDVVNDADDEKEKVSHEADEDSARARSSFEDDYSTTPGNMNKNPFINGSDEDDDADDDDADGDTDNSDGDSE
ncbi:MAG: phage portal protein [Victivallales bacterium]